MNKRTIITHLVVAVLSVAITMYLRPAPETKIETREHETVQTRIVTKVVHIKDPNGGERTETIITDNSTQVRDARMSLLQSKKAQYVVGVGVAVKTSDFSAPEYNLLVARRIIGPVFLGVTASTDKSVGALVSLEF